MDEGDIWDRSDLSLRPQAHLQEAEAMCGRYPPERRVPGGEPGHHFPLVSSHAVDRGGYRRGGRGPGRGLPSPQAVELT